MLTEPNQDDGFFSGPPSPAAHDDDELFAPHNDVHDSSSDEEMEEDDLMLSDAEMDADEGDTLDDDEVDDDTGLRLRECLGEEFERDAANNGELLSRTVISRFILII